MSHAVDSLEQWFDGATEGLGRFSKSRIAAEISGQYREACRVALEAGHEADAAEAMALEALGDIKKARKRFRKQYLKVKTEKRIGKQFLGDEKISSRSLWGIVLLGAPLILWFYSLTESFTVLYFWGCIPLFAGCELGIRRCVDRAEIRKGKMVEIAFITLMIIGFVCWAISVDYVENSWPIVVINITRFTRHYSAPFSFVKPQSIPPKPFPPATTLQSPLPSLALATSEQYASSLCPAPWVATCQLSRKC